MFTFFASEMITFAAYRMPLVASGVYGVGTQSRVEQHWLDTLRV